jgi:multiple sugar transport system permease protein
MRSRSKTLKRDMIGYLFLSPWILGFLAITLIPISVSFYLSLTSYDMFSSPEWLGFENYITMLTDDIRFMNSVKVTLIYVFLGVPLELVFALLLAISLNKGINGLSLYRAIYYIPSLFGGSVAIAILWRKVFGTEGFFNQFLEWFGIEGISWISTPSTAIYTLVLLKVWQFGSPMIIFLAGLKQIPNDLYEAAAMDGAGRVSKFFKVTLPLLTPIVFFNLVMQIIHAFQAFTPAYIISDGKGGPLDSTLFYTLYLYQQGFTNFNMGYASAMAWFLLSLIAFITTLLFISSRRWVYYEQ